MTRIQRVPVETQTRAPGGRTNAYVVGDPAVLVDPPARTPELDAALADRDLAHVVVTHTHPDHVGGVAAYAGGTTVWAHADHRDRFVDATGVAPGQTFEDGTRIPVGGEVGDLVVVATPGHAPDHVAFALETGSEEEVLVGDLAVAEGSVAVAAPEGDLLAYLDSLQRLRERSLVRLYPGHGPVIDDPGATLTRLIDHRRERERRVLAAVEDGARTPDEVLAAAYEKDLSGVRDLARATVVAHLEALADQGRIGFDGERAIPE